MSKIYIAYYVDEGGSILKKKPSEVKEYCEM